jgi:hypothetical protein
LARRRSCPEVVSEADQFFIEAALKTNRKAVAMAIAVVVQASARAAATRSLGSAGSGMGLSVTDGFPRTENR